MISMVARSGFAGSGVRGLAVRAFAVRAFAVRALARVPVGAHSQPPSSRMCWGLAVGIWECVGASDLGVRWSLGFGTWDLILPRIPRTVPYPPLSAAMGSIRVARVAGIRLAMM